MWHWCVNWGDRSIENKQTGETTNWVYVACLEVAVTQCDLDVWPLATSPVGVSERDDICTDPVNVFVLCYCPVEHRWEE